MPNGFKDKVVLVTGANGGIGRAMCDAFHSKGAVVVGTDLTCHNENIPHNIEGDLSDPSFRDNLISTVVQKVGPIDVLCNNAGIITRGDITKASDDDYARTMAINVEAPFKLCRDVIPVMAQNGGGAIVNTASCWGVYPGPDHPLYVMSKAAVVSLTRCLGRDHAKDGVRVNAVCPNEVNTPMLRSGFGIRGIDPDDGINQLNKTVPLGRIAEPEDIVDVVTFLASNESRYMTGAILEVNGGKPVG